MREEDCARAVAWSPRAPRLPERISPLIAKRTGGFTEFKICAKRSVKGGTYEDCKKNTLLPRGCYRDAPCHRDVVGVPQDEIRLNALPLVFGGRSIHGSLTGTPIDGEDTPAFSVLESIRPMIETVPLEQAADAYARMMQGKARFRMVLVTRQ